MMGGVGGAPPPRQKVGPAPAHAPPNTAAEKYTAKNSKSAAILAGDSQWLLYTIDRLQLCRRTFKWHPGPLQRQ